MKLTPHFLILSMALVVGACEPICFWEGAIKSRADALARFRRHVVKDYRSVLGRVGVDANELFDKTILNSETDRSLFFTDICKLPSHYAIVQQYEGGRYYGDSPIFTVQIGLIRKASSGVSWDRIEIGGALNKCGDLERPIDIYYNHQKLAGPPTDPNSFTAPRACPPVDLN